MPLERRTAPKGGTPSSFRNNRARTTRQSGYRLLRPPRAHPLGDSDDPPGVQLFYLSRIMGTSVEMISQTYGHLVPDSEDYLRGLLDEFDAASVAEEGVAP
jgi:hypothetical protein